MDEGQIMTNTEFDYTLAGKVYKVKKATLPQVMDFYRKVDQIAKEKDAAGELRMATYAVYVLIHAVDSTITEEYVTENLPGDIDVTDIFVKLGFMSQQKMLMLRRDLLASRLNGENSSAS